MLLQSHPHFFLIQLTIWCFHPRCRIESFFRTLTFRTLTFFDSNRHRQATIFESTKVAGNLSCCIVGCSVEANWNFSLDRSARMENLAEELDKVPYDDFIEMKAQLADIC